MKTNIYFASLIFICYSCAGILHAADGSLNGARQLSATEKLKVDFDNGLIPASSPGFAENKGQVQGFDGSSHPEVKFTFKQGSTQLFLLASGIAYQFTRTRLPEGYEELISGLREKQDIKELQRLQEQARTETFRMDMRLLGANANAKITTEGKSSDYINYYNFNALDVRQYAKVTYHDIYPGIDWVVYTKNGQVKYDFVIQPGADPSLIQMQFAHQEALALNNDGGFTLKNRLGSIAEKKPVSYQQGKEIGTDFILNNDVISFALAAYDRGQQLVIDPVLVWATYYGGTDAEDGWSTATDAAGNVYLAGVTGSAAGIASGGYQNTFGGGMQPDAFLVKFNSSGVRQWATYYGGTGNEYGYNCATDASGNVYLAGITTSSLGIASGGYQNIFSAPNQMGESDAFLVKFDSSGVRQWATYYGGRGDESAYACATDPAGNIYLAGSTQSSVGIAAGGYQNAMVGSNSGYLVKFDGNGIRLWATYYGGVGGADPLGCATDASGDIYMTGATLSTSGIASGGYQNTFAGGNADAFLVKFNSSGALQWGTYYGGSGNDESQSCTTDASGNVFISGYTNSSSGIASGGHQNIFGGGISDAFLVKFNGSGLRQWATYYGGADKDVGLGCASNGSGDVYLTGYTASQSSIASGGIQNSYGGADDAFLVKFSNSGTRQWGTYYGGIGWDGGNNCTVDVSGQVYLAGATTSSAGIASGGCQNTFGGGSSDAFLLKIYDDVFTSLNETQEQQNTVNVFPNPSSGSFEIASETDVYIIIYNEVGQLLWESNSGKPKKSVTVQGLAKGIYLARIFSDSGSTVRKIVVSDN